MDYSKYLLKRTIGPSNEYDYKMILNTLFKNCKKILDIGCGRGNFITFANKNKKMYGIDINKDVIKFCLNEKLNVKFGSTTKIPFRDEFFDGIYCSHVIEHLDRDELIKASKEIYRVLKKGGICIIITPNFIHNIEEFYSDPTHVSPFTEKRAKLLFNKFSSVKVMYHPYYIPKIKGLLLKHIKIPKIYTFLLKIIPFRSKKELWIILKK